MGRRKFENLFSEVDLEGKAVESAVRVFNKTIVGIAVGLSIGCRL
jgi:hypothetical protein